jgi:hypothetical protein
MKSRFSLASGLLVALLRGFAGAAERDVEKELAAFAFEGVSLSMPQAEFVRRAGGFASFRTDRETSVTTYHAASPKHADAAFYDLLDGKVQRIHIIYSPGRLQDMGGATLVRDKLTERFGVPRNATVNNDAKVWFWGSPRGPCRLSFIVMTNNAASIIMVDTAGEKIIEERKLKKMDLGIGNKVAQTSFDGIAQTSQEPVQDWPAISNRADKNKGEDNNERIADLQTDIAEQSENEVLQRHWATLLNDIDAEQTRALGPQKMLRR